MPKKPTEPLHRFHVNLFEADYLRLRELYGDGPGMAEAVRVIVRNALRRVDERKALAQSAVQINPELVDSLLEDRDVG